MDAGNPTSRRTDRATAVIIDAGIGNIDSVAAVFRFLGADFRLVSAPEDLTGASHVILPGVGAYRAGMAALDRHRLIAPIRELALTGGLKLIGICLGMQLLGEHSEEGDCEGLGLVPFSVRRIAQSSPGAAAVKVPHVGFTTVSGYQPAGLFKGLGAAADFYFTHSFAVHALGVDANIGWTHYGGDLVAAFDAGRICGAQFHPEKSQSNGLQMFKNFLAQ